MTGNALAMPHAGRVFHCEWQAIHSQPTGGRVTITPMQAEQTDTRHRILVVDDEPSIVDAVATALRYEDYDVEEASERS